MTKLIVVLGATGIQGGSVVSTFLADPAWKVRGVTRNNSSPAAKKLTARGVEVVEGDIDNSSSLDSAFAGANAIFAVTDFWSPFFQAYPKLRDTSDRATGEHAFAVEVKRGKAIADAAAKVLATEKGLERFVWSSLPPVKQLSGGKFTYVYHFDAKAEIARYIEKEQPALWKQTSLLNMGFYITNMVAMAEIFAPKKEADGSYTISTPGSKDAKHPQVEPHDAGIFAALLINSAPGKNLLGVGEMISWEDFGKIFSEHLGAPVQIKELPIDGRDKLLPGGLGREASESMTFSSEFGWGKDLLMPKDIDANVKLTSVKDYIQSEDWDALFSKQA
ncbi:hypothetical protein V500_05449 [Pseudogymnoascus sp. VKM F-4518 (FW-2643)]|nr:hypothetical protein V500_05449 [Pseudogymnoascus sp. VKM F-4518 (FW-2643)]